MSAEEEKKKEVQEGLMKLGYAYGFIARVQVHSLDDIRAKVVCDGCVIGIYDFTKHTFVD